mgnify:CR=1 FL=1
MGQKRGRRGGGVRLHGSDGRDNCRFFFVAELTRSSIKLCHHHSDFHSMRSLEDKHALLDATTMLMGVFR